MYAFIPRLHREKMCQHGIACFVSVNMCRAVPCRAMPCCAGPPQRSGLTQYSTTRHCFFGVVNESELSRLCRYSKTSILSHSHSPFVQEAIQASEIWGEMYDFWPSCLIVLGSSLVLSSTMVTMIVNGVATCAIAALSWALGKAGEWQQMWGRAWQKNYHYSTRSRHFPGCQNLVRTGTATPTGQ